MVEIAFEMLHIYLPNYTASHFTSISKGRAATFFEMLIGLFTYQITGRQTVLPGR
jgi:hypothetical protein